MTSFSEINFEGPMDLLLQLVERKEVDIYDILINEITDEFLYHMNKASISPDRVSSFIVMAASLLEIKSKAMLPVEIEQIDESYEDLMERILEYRKAKAVARLLLEKRQEASLSHARPGGELISDRVEINMDQDIDFLSQIYVKLMDKFLEFEEVSNINEGYVEAEEYDTANYIEKIQNLIGIKKFFNITDLIDEHVPKAEIITIFLSILELIKRRVIWAKQVESDIYIEEKNEQ